MEELNALTIRSFIPVSIFALFGAVFCVILFIFNCKYRELRIIKMSSPNMNTLIIIGGYLLYVSCALYGLIIFIDSAIIIQIWLWTLCLSYTLFFGSMFAKSWRVYRIFKNAATKRTVIRDHTLILIILILLLVDVAILGLWQGLDPITSQVPAKYQKFTSKYLPIWIGIMLLKNGSMLLYGLYLSWATRHVTLPSMNDSSTIIISSHVTTLMASAAITLSTVINNSPDATYLVMTSSIWVSTTVSLCLIFIPKLIRVWKAKNDANEHAVKISSHIFTSTNSTFEQIEDELYHLVAENRALKSSLNQKDVTIATLQTHVISAKEKLLQIHPEDRHDSGLDIDCCGSSNQDAESPGSNKESPVSTGTTGISGTSSSDIQISPYQYQTPKFQSNLSELGLSEIKPENNFNFSDMKENVKRFNGNRGRMSIRSAKSGLSDFDKISVITNSVVRDLEQCDNISKNLRSVINYEINSKHSPAYQYIKTQQDIVGAITDSYAMSDNSDTFSFISSHLRSKRNKVVQPKCQVYNESEINCPVSPIRYETPVKMHAGSACSSTCDSIMSSPARLQYYTERQYQQRRLQYPLESDGHIGNDSVYPNSKYGRTSGSKSSRNFSKQQRKRARINNFEHRGSRRSINIDGMSRGSSKNLPQNRDLINGPVLLRI